MKHFILSLIFLLAVLFSCFAQSAGYYYDTTGNKINGLIAFTGTGFILYKENKQAKNIRLTPDDNISGFVVGTDSFSIVTDSTLSVLPAKRFVHILEDGKLKLYDFSMLFSNNGGKQGENKNQYYFVMKNEKIYKINEIGWMYNFKKVMAEILNDYPELEDDYIKKNKLYISNIKFIVEKYNSHFRPAPGIKN